MIKLLNILSIIGLLFTPNIKPNYYNDFSQGSLRVDPFMSSLYTENTLQFTSYMSSNSDFDTPSYLITYDSYENYYFYISTFYLTNSDSINYNSLFFNVFYEAYNSDWTDNNGLFELYVFHTDYSHNDFLSSSFIDGLAYLDFDYKIYVNNDFRDINHIDYYYINDDFLGSSRYTYFIWRVAYPFHDNYIDGYDNIVNSIYNNTWANPSYYGLGGQYENYLYMPQFMLCEMSSINKGYYDGFNDGVNSIDTESIYNDGVNFGASQVDTQHYYDTGYQIGYAEGLTHSTHSYGIVELGYAIFNMPILVLSNLLSFTIFGQEFWGLIVSFMFLGLILWLVKLFIKGGGNN